MTGEFNTLLLTMDHSGRKSINIEKAKMETLP